MSERRDFYCVDALAALERRAVAAEKRAEEAEGLLRQVISGKRTVVIEVALEDEIHAVLALERSQAGE